jgi:hypothetical protein
MRFAAAELTVAAVFSIVLPLLRKDFRFFLAGTLLAVALRLMFVLHFPAVVDDSRLYADIAENWLQYGVYGVTDSGQVVPTLSRLPGYPAFLAAVFTIFGWSNFRAVLFIQLIFDVGACFVIADLARRMFSERSSKAAFLLAALCPFLANYCAAALTETLEIFFTALAFDFAIAGLSRLHSEDVTRLSVGAWIGCGLSIAACILMRPDGGILLAAIGGFSIFLLAKAIIFRNSQSFSADAKTIFRAGVLVGVAALLPLLPWTLRNLRTFHRFEPLAPRYANDSDEPAMPGFNRWTKTWIADYASVQEIYWNVPGEAINVNRLPGRAFDSDQQKQETAELFSQYDQDHDMTPELDAAFAALAAARIRSGPFRYYVELPAIRIADMWLRPRTELLPSDPRWWEFNDESPWLAVSIIFGVINLGYVAAATAGLFRSRAFFGWGLLVLFIVLRSLFLGTLENPEPRYTLECYPLVILALSALFSARSSAGRGQRVRS